MDIQVKHLAKSAKLLLVALPLLTTQIALAAPTTWTGGSNTNWNDGANWSAGIPGAADTAVFTGVPGTLPTNFINDTATLLDLNFDGATGSFTVTNEGTMNLSGGISNTSGLVQTLDNQAFLTFSGTSDASDATIINDVSLDISGLAGAGMNIGTLSGNGNVILGNKNLTVGGLLTSDTINGIISGSGGLVKEGAGTTLTLNGANTYTGQTTINDANSVLSIAGFGALQSSGVNIANADAVLEFDTTAAPKIYAGVITGSGILRQVGDRTSLILTGDSPAAGFTGSVELQGYLRLGDGGTSGSIDADIATSDGNSRIIFNRSNPVTYPGTISGAGGLRQIGSGMLTITGDSSARTGGTFITTGSTLQLGDGGVVGNIGVADIGNDGMLIINRSDPVTIDNYIYGTGSLQKLGGNVVTITQNNDYAGTTTVAAGELRIGDGGTSGRLVAPVVVNAGAKLTFDRSDDLAWRDTISGAGAVEKDGAGLMVFTEPQYYTGITTITNGTLRLSSRASVVGDIVNNSVLEINNNLDYITYGGVISGSGTLFSPSNQSGLILTGDNTYTGDTTVGNNGGFLQIGNGGTSGSIVSNVFLSHTSSRIVFNRADDLTYNEVISGTGALIQRGDGVLTLTADHLFTGTTSIEDSGSLRLGNGGVSGSLASSSIFVDGKLIIDRSDDFTLSNSLFGQGQIEKRNTNTVTIDRSGDFTGTTTIAAGALQIGNGGTTGDLDGPIVNNGSFIWNRSDNFNFNQEITGSGSLTKLGAGRLTLRHPTSYTGSTTVTEGELRIQDHGTIENSNNIFLDTNGTIYFNTNTFDVYYGGVISGPGQLIKNSLSGRLILTGDNTYTGPTTLIASVMEVGDGGTSGSLTSDITGTINANSGVIFNRSDTTTYANVVSGFAYVRQQGSGKLILTGENTFSSPLYIDSGSVQLGAGGNSGMVNTNDIFNEGVLIIDREDLALTLDSRIRGSGDVIKQGSGLLTFTANNLYTGTTTINDGILQVGDGGGLGQIVGPLVINSGTEFWFNRSDNVNFDSPISGVGGFTKLGSGILSLRSDSRAYTGNITVSQGELRVGGGSYFGMIGSHSIVNNATLSFSNTINATLDSIISGSGRIEKFGSSSLTLTGDSSAFSGTSELNNGVLSIGNGGTSGALGGAIENGAILRFRHSDTYTQSNVIGGTGQVQQFGSGTLILNAVNEYTGLTTVNTGTLLVGGTESNSNAYIAGDVQVDPQGTFGGHGMVGGSVVNEGVVSPGASIGVTTVLGDYTQPANGTLLVEINSAGQSDVLNVGGVANIAGNLALDVSAGFQPGASYTIINTGDGVIGNFTNVNGLGNFSQNFLSGNVQLIDNSLVLTPSFNREALLLAGNTHNRRSFANYLLATGGSPGLQALVAGIVADSRFAQNVQFGEIADRVVGASYANQQLQLAETADWFSRQMADRMVIAPCHSMHREHANTGKPCERHTALWFMPYGSSANIDAGDASGLDTSMGGAAIGVDFPVTDHGKFGMSFATTYFSSEAADNENTTDSGTLYQFGAYGSYQHDQWLLGASIDVGGTDNIDATRKITDLSGVPGVNGSYSAGLFSQQIRAAYDMMLRNNAHMHPFIGLVNQVVTGEAFTETGNPNFALTIHPENYHSLRSQLGTGVEMPMGSVDLLASVAWQHEFSDTQSSFDASIASVGGESVNIQGTAIGRESAVVKAGLKLIERGPVSVSAMYEGVFADDYSENGGKLQININVG